MTLINYGSSSSGNCYLVGTDNNRIMLDAGVNFFKNNLNLINLLSVRFVLISHEHLDHTKHLKTFLMKNAIAIVIINNKCYEALVEADPFYSLMAHRFYFTDTFYKKDLTFEERGLTFETFKVFHNSERNNGYVIEFKDFKSNKKVKFIYMTDAGGIDRKTFLSCNFENLDFAMVESNYDDDILEVKDIKTEIQASNIGHQSYKNSLKVIKYLKSKNINNNNLIFYLIHTSKAHEQVLKELDKLNAGSFRMERMEREQMQEFKILC